MPAKHVKRVYAGSEIFLFNHDRINYANHGLKIAISGELQRVMALVNP